MTDYATVVLVMTVLALGSFTLGYACGLVDGFIAKGAFVLVRRVARRLRGTR